MKQEHGRKRLKAILDGRERTSCEQSDFHSSRCCGRNTHCWSNRNVRLLSVRSGKQTDDDIFVVDLGLCGHMPICSVCKRNDSGWGRVCPPWLYGREDDLRLFPRRSHRGDWKEQHGVLDERRYHGCPSHGYVRRRRRLRFWEHRTADLPGRHVPVHIHCAWHIHLPLLFPPLDAGDGQGAGRKRDGFLN